MRISGGKRGNSKGNALPLWAVFKAAIHQIHLFLVFMEYEILHGLVLGHSLCQNAYQAYHLLRNLCDKNSFGRTLVIGGI